MELLSGCTLQQGRYRIIRTLGRGGFGITYLAEQVLAKRKVCIKEFFPKDYYKRDSSSQHIFLSSDGFGKTMGRFMDKFLKEAQLIAGLDHPNIIRIHDVFEENGTAYYVMEYIEGESLQSIVSQRGAMSETEATNYIAQLAAALSYIHSHDIAHLDVKPGNIMVRAKDYRTVLIDFGLSKHYDMGGVQTSSTPIGISHGYAPMEQYQVGGVSTFSPRTDIYSMGATLYFLLVGKTPPTAAAVSEDGLNEIPSHLSKSTRIAIERAMQPRRKDRPASAEDFMSLLKDNNSTVPIGLQSKTLPTKIESNPAQVLTPEIEPKPIQELTPEIEPNQAQQPTPEPEPIQELTPEIESKPIQELTPEIEPNQAQQPTPEPEPIQELTSEIEPKPIQELTPEIEPNQAQQPTPEPKPIPQPAQKLTPKPQPTPPADNKHKSSKWWLLLLVVIAIVGVLFTLGDDEKKPSPKPIVAPATEIIEADSITEEIVNHSKYEHKTEVTTPTQVTIEHEESIPNPVLTRTSKSSVTHNADSSNGKISFKISNPRNDIQVTAKSNVPWISVKVLTDSVSYTTTANESDSGRSGKITVKYGNQSFEVVISQTGIPVSVTEANASIPNPVLTLTSKSNVTHNADNSNGKISFKISNPRDDIKVTAESNVSWISVKVLTNSVSYTIKANDSDCSRSGKITATYGNQSFEVYVIQEGKPKPIVPEGKMYEVGDYYYEDGKHGVVFEVWDGGRHGKIVSLDETYAAWDSRVELDVTTGYSSHGTLTFANSKSDGKANTDKIMARSDSQYFEAFKWCRTKGNTWYLPALNELNTIYNNRSKINATLHKYGATTLGSWFWSSTEYVDNKPEFCAWGVNMRKGNANRLIKNDYNYVRAVSAF